MDKFRDRIRRLMFMVCLGFGAYVAGNVISFQLFNRLSSRLTSSGALLRFVILTVVGELWAIAILPLFCYGAARVIELRPWTTAVAGVVTGETFSLALQVISTGFDLPWRFLVAQGVGIALGVFASAQAVKRGRAAALRGEEAARKAAEARKSEYDEFKRAAERAAVSTGDRATANVASPAPPASDAPADSPPAQKPS
jgi:hypothetical protein